MVDILFEKLYKEDRVAAPCFIAVPFAKGTLESTDFFTVMKEGRKYLTQSRVTSRWEDGSVRWAFVRFLADLPGNEKCTYQLITSSDELMQNHKSSDTQMKTKSQQSCLKLHKTEEAYCIETGSLSFATQTGSQGLFSYIKYRNNTERSNHSPDNNYQEFTYKAGAMPGPVITIGHNEYPLTIESWDILEEGPVCIKLRANCYHEINTGSVKNGGNLANDDSIFKVQKTQRLKVETEVTCYAGKSYLEIGYRIFNTTKEPVMFDSIVYEIIPNQKATRTCVAVSNYKTKYDVSDTAQTVSHRIDSNELLYEANEHIAEVYYGTLFGDVNSEQGGICATIYQAQQNYPKGITASADKLQIYLIPESDTKIIMQSGMARKQSFQIYFHDGSQSLEEINTVSNCYQMPDRALLSPKVYEESRVFYDVFIKEKKPMVEMSLISKADSHARCYGMLNWGDSPDPGYTTQGRGNGAPVWTNNEYDYPHACALMYARSGIRRFLEYVFVSAQHWMDVDICHYSEDPLIYQGQWEHTHHHVLDTQIVCSHQWVEGLLDYYHLSGEKEAYDTAIGIGENILRILKTPMFQQKGEINARETGWAMRSLVALYTETYDKRWLAECDWIVGHFEEWEKQYGHWLSPYTSDTEIRVPFMISIAVGSLMRYYRVSPQEKIRDMIIRAVDDLIENCYLSEYGVFFYKELPSLNRLGTNTIVLEALQIAYELTGKAEYLNYGVTTFMMAVSGGILGLGGAKHVIGDAVISAGPGTKGFAQSFLPIVTFYKAAVENGLI